MKKYLIPSGSTKAEPIAAGSGTSKEVLIGPDLAPNFALRKFVMDAGGGMPLHTNTVEHEQYILKGSADVTIGEERFTAKAGDAVYIPRGVPHSYKAGPEGFEFLCIVPNKDDTIQMVK